MQGASLHRVWYCQKKSAPAQFSAGDVSCCYVQTGAGYFMGLCWKRRFWSGLLILGGCLAGLSACGSQQTPPQPSIVSRPSHLTTQIARATATASATAGSPTPAATEPPSPSPTATASPSPTPALTAVASQGQNPVLAATLPPTEHVAAMALGGDTPVRSAPSMATGTTVATLADHQSIVILNEVRGQRWVVGDQTWPMAFQDWSNLWYQINGGYVYAGFVYIPRPGELGFLQSPVAARWVDVDLSTQTARAMVGNQAVFTAAVTTGKDGYETPAGMHTIEPWGRKFNETMTSAQAGIKAPSEQYDVHNVLYTQYFDTAGDALHLNYWQPASTFGAARTSHGCVGMMLHDAQFFWLFATPGMRVNIHPVPPTPAATSTATVTPPPVPSTPSSRVAPPASSTSAAQNAGTPATTAIVSPATRVPPSPTP